VRLALNDRASGVVRPEYTAAVLEKQDLKADSLSSINFNMVDISFELE